MFGIANQLLASVALCVATTIIINSGKRRYAWTTLLPLTFVATTTLVAGYQSITDIFWPLAQKQEMATQGYINVALTIILMTAAVIVIVDSIRRWTGGSTRAELNSSFTDAPSVEAYMRCPSCLSLSSFARASL